MPPIARDSLLTLEAYAKKRPEMRAQAIAHKRARTVHLGEHLTLLFEDETTIRYQIQEMLRIEKTFEEEAIQDELDVYNPLVPDGSNLKATMLIEYEDEDERRSALAGLRGIEDAIWLQVDDEPRVTPIADEDLDRETADKTGSLTTCRYLSIQTGIDLSILTRALRHYNNDLTISSSKSSVTCSPRCTVRARLCATARARNAGRSFA